MLIYKMLTIHLLTLISVKSTLIKFVKVRMNIVNAALPFC